LELTEGELGNAINAGFTGWISQHPIEPIIIGVKIHHSLLNTAIIQAQLAKVMIWHEADKAAAIRAERERADKFKSALESDATDLWKITNAIKTELKNRSWIFDEGRGCYAWDDQKYKDETRLAFEAVLELIKNVQHPAQDRFWQALKGDK
jgi:hypothetical protein